MKISNNYKKFFSLYTSEYLLICEIKYLYKNVIVKKRLKFIKF